MEYDLAILGGGPGGYVAAIRAAQLGMQVALIDVSKRLGGTCLNVGCIPSKTLLHATELYASYATARADWGIEAGKAHMHLDELMKKKDAILQGLGEGIDGLMKKNKIARYEGRGTLYDAHTFQVEKEKVQARHLLLATGSLPLALSCLPFDGSRVISSTEALSLREVPRHLIVVGAGAIGLEMGSVYARLGSRVTFVEFLDRVCPAMDKAISKGLESALKVQGMEFLLAHEVVGGNVKGKTVELELKSREGAAQKLEGDVVLVAIGRGPKVEGIGLEKVGIALDRKNRIQVNGSFQTSVPHIYAIGDVIDGPMLAHKAEEEGVAVAEILSGKKVILDYMAIPNVVYTAPEAASVGFTEEMAKEHGIAVAMGTFPMKANSRARATGHTEGVAKVVGDKATGRLLGVHILAHGASEMIGEGVVALEKKMTVEELASASHAHPTFSESLKEAALDALKRALHK